LTEQLRADVVVMGALSRSGLKGLFLGNTAEDVLDRLHSDLVIVKPTGFQGALGS
jgi:universal stress protein E